MNSSGGNCGGGGGGCQEGGTSEFLFLISPFQLRSESFLQLDGIHVEADGFGWGYFRE